MIRLCTKCNANAKKFNMMNTLLALCRRGWWHCPYSKPDCGKIIEDATQNPAPEPKQHTPRTRTRKHR